MQHEPVKIKCPACNKAMMMSPDTTACPNCSMEFNPKVVHDMFHELSLIKNRTESAQKISKGVQETGKSMNDIGCAFMMIPIAVIALIILFSLLG